MSDYDFKSAYIICRRGSYEPFVYIIQETSSNRLYIGSKTARGCKLEDLGKSYFTSSKLIKDKWKRDPDRFTIVDQILCKSNHHALKLEELLIRRNNAVWDDKYINMGLSNLGFRWTPKAKKELSEKMMGTKNPKHSKRMSGKNNPYYSKTHSQEIRDKISNAVLSSRKEECEHCQRVFSASRYEKYHGDMCEWKGCSQEEVNLIKHMTTTKLAKKKYNFKNWLNKNPDFKEYFTFFDYLKIGMIEMNRRVREEKFKNDN